MQKEVQQNHQEQQILENWVKPAFTLLSVKEETLGLGGGGPDFGSELS